MSSPQAGQHGTFTLERTGNSQLIVDGVVLASEGARYEHGPAAREFRLLFIRADSGRYVVGIRYITNVKNDRCISGVSICQTLADVRDAVVRYGESLDSLPIGYPPGPQFWARQETLIRDLRNTFNEVAGRLLSRPEFAERV